MQITKRYTGFQSNSTYPLPVEVSYDLLCIWRDFHFIRLCSLFPRISVTSAHFQISSKQSLEPLQGYLKHFSLNMKKNFRSSFSLCFSLTPLSSLPYSQRGNYLLILISSPFITSSRRCRNNDS